MQVLVFKINKHTINKLYFVRYAFINSSPFLLTLLFSIGSEKDTHFSLFPPRHLFLLQILLLAFS